MNELCCCKCDVPGSQRSVSLFDCPGGWTCYKCSSEDYTSDILVRDSRLKCYHESENGLGRTSERCIRCDQPACDECCTGGYRDENGVKGICIRCLACSCGRFVEGTSCRKCIHCAKEICNKCNALPMQKTKTVCLPCREEREEYECDCICSPIPYDYCEQCCLCPHCRSEDYDRYPKEDNDAEEEEYFLDPRRKCNSCEKWGCIGCTLKDEATGKSFHRKCL